MEKALGGGCDVGQGAEGDTGGQQTQVGNILTYLEPTTKKINQPPSSWAVELDTWQLEDDAAVDAFIHPQG